MSNIDNIQLSQEVALNISTPISTLRHLYQDPEIFVRLNLSRNPNLPIDLLYQFSRDRNCGIRDNIAYNSSTPIKLLFKLIFDPERMVRRTARNNIIRKSIFMSIYRANVKIIQKLNSYSLGAVSLWVIGLLVILFSISNLFIYFSSRVDPIVDVEEENIENKCQDSFFVINTYRSASCEENQTIHISKDQTLAVCRCNKDK